MVTVFGSVKNSRLKLPPSRPHPESPTPPNGALRAEILERYRALVQIDSTAGHETLVVEYLKKALEDEGITTKTFALDPTRANLVARIAGSGTKRPLLILAHTDVVGVQREKWPVDPFGAVMKDGYIWGRGSKDDKPVLTANLMNIGGITDRLVRLSRTMVGHFPGALAQINVLLSVFFAGISGYSTADAASQSKI